MSVNFLAKRAVTNSLQGSCQLPIASYARIDNNLPLTIDNKHNPPSLPYPVLLIRGAQLLPYHLGHRTEHRPAVQPKKTSVK